ncbi:MAG TPA: HAD-IIB family hydrolase [Wenzhouxiangella sp.]|nr:HAD-IIB family hydrolase [Wenzhouxiangella sp.]
MSQQNLKPHSQARYLLCSDLDRTVIPNGPQAESPGARKALRRLIENRAICVVYVTGRDQILVKEAIHRFDLPWPDAVIGDVGTQIWSTFDQDWSRWSQWEDLIRMDFSQDTRAAAQRLAARVANLEMQSNDRQTEYKLSYFCPMSCLERAKKELENLFSRQQLPVSVIASLDETSDQGLVDILPDRATKQGAIEMVMSAWGFNHWSTVCAGDSGNDLPFLTSALQSVLVANATDAVREQALAMAQARGQIDNLYLARGGLYGMNGCYAAGVVEGFLHYIPQAQEWLD